MVWFPRLQGKGVDCASSPSALSGRLRSSLDGFQWTFILLRERQKERIWQRGLKAGGR